MLNCFAFITNIAENLTIKIIMAETFSFFFIMLTAFTFYWRLYDFLKIFVNLLRYSVDISLHFF